MIYPKRALKSVAQADSRLYRRLAVGVVLDFATGLKSFTGSKMKRIPSATYRLQFNREFTFEQARAILDYLRELGVSDVYASPLFQAGPQSTHGYDTCCFGKINPNIGSTEDFNRFAGDLKERGLGLLLDLVPNHMSATLSNPWWVDVLENGRESRFAHFFDVNWNAENPALRGKVLLPVLEDEYRKVLEAGKLQFVRDNGKCFIAYYERKFPVNPQSLAECGIENSERAVHELNCAAGRRAFVRQVGCADSAPALPARVLERCGEGNKLPPLL